MKQIPFWTSWWLLHLLVHNTWKKSKSFWAKWVAPRDDAKTLLTLSRNVVDVTATRVFPQDSQMGPHRWNPNKPPQNDSPSSKLLSPPSHPSQTNNGGSSSDPRLQNTPFFSIFTRSPHTHFVFDPFVPVFELRPPWKAEMEGPRRRQRV